MKRMLFRVRFLSLVVFAMFAGVWPIAAQAAVPAGTAPRLGTALNFAVLGASTVTSTGATVITGDLGVSPGTSVTGSPTVHGTVHAGDPVAAQAQADLAIAFADAVAATPTADLTGKVLGQTAYKTLTPGVYKFNTSAQLTGTLTLSGNGVYIFQIGTTITTASASQVVLDGAQACAVFWQVGSSATLGTSTQFVGNIMAYASITLTTGVTLNGRALAETAAVTMDSNTITLPTGPCTSAPGSCSNGAGKDTDENADQSKDSADNNKSADEASSSSNGDDNGKNSEGNGDKGHNGCDSGNSNEGDSNQGNSNEGNSNEGNSTKADTSKAATSKAETSKAETSKAETTKAETSKAETTQANTTKAHETKANTTKANTTKANATHSNDSHDGGESGSQGG